ncbi:MAG: hypothetical protein J7604_23795 [Sporocytophaga sp.]|uniref:hypothetical protein n=1 Tax=Sporocytophaga sp. TaxID=2231183 RepID=UPI001B1A9491|nr:hypothetical protein [Sporocytophaga sp.]MBO9703259.1 hypothetical protein [Sporocytophaga sp.]
MKRFFSATRGSKIRNPSGWVNDEILIGQKILCTDSKWILQAYSRTEFLSWSPGREFEKLIGSAESPV